MSERLVHDSLRVLIIEDSPADATAVAHELRRVHGSVAWERVDDEASLRSALGRAEWDVVISDSSMPTFGAIDALRIVKETDDDVPFIIVSGTVGEEPAVEAMRQGVHDYVLKDRIARLAPAVERQLRERRERDARRKAEEALPESQSLYRRIVETTNEGVWMIDADSITTFVNARMATMLGCDPGEIVGRPIFDFVVGDESLDTRHAIRQNRSGLPTQVEVQLRRADGKTFWALLGSTPSIDESGKYRGALGMVMDIDDRKRTEEALRASEAKFARLSESGIIGICVTDLIGNVHDANDAYLQMIGCSRADLRSGSINWLRSTPPEFEGHDGAALDALQRFGIAPAWEKELVRKDGSRVPILVGLAMLDRTRCIAFQADLSERKKAEEALRAAEERFRHAQKMEAVGLLAGGVAHDFNNLLSVILSYSAMLAEDLKPGDPMRADLEQIRSAGQRAAELTRQLLAFSRRQVLRPEALNLNEAVARTEKMLRRLIGEDIDLRIAGPTDLGIIHVDPGQLEQVLVNLVVNARDAMPNGGRLTIETANVTLDQHYVSEHRDATAGQHVMLAVSDSGLGMDQATQARIFEPFFTTKETGRGTGLGLSTVYGLVKQSGGSIWVYSEPGKGSTFKIYLPRVRDGACAPVHDQPAPPAAPMGTETVLLVEDEERVRTLARTILSRFGYHVLEAQGGEEALLLSEHYTAPIHLLLTDCVMPHMSGPEVAARLARTRPSLKVLYMSGYTDKAVVHHGVLDSDVEFIQKPLTPDALGRMVRQVLDAGVGAGAEGNGCR